MSDVLLTAGGAARHLVSRGVVPTDADVAAEELGGGVSNVVLGITAGEDRLVLKQALPRLRVADEWLATRRRTLTEAAAIELVRQVTPQAVPTVVDVDTATCTIAITRAPATWTTWKQALLAGRVELAVADRLGGLLAAWHRLDASEVPGLDDPVAFEQLRIDPYYRTVARRTPDLAPAIDALVERMATRRRCLVHGDFSPKNVLVGPDGLWVIDFEVAHLGDPAFDLAFLLSHLVLKSVHRRDDANAHLACAEAFLAAYLAGNPAASDDDPAHRQRHLGALLLARVDGKSPAEYLTPGQHGPVRTLGRELLLSPAVPLDAVWRRLTEVAT